MKRTIKISINLDPPISGYGGYDEWKIELAGNETQDEIITKIDNLVNDTVEKYKLDGGYIGVE